MFALCGSPECDYETKNHIQLSDLRHELKHAYKYHTEHRDVQENPYNDSTDENSRLMCPKCKAKTLFIASRLE